MSNNHGKEVEALGWEGIDNDNLLNKSKEIAFKSVNGLIIQVEKTEIRNRMGEVAQIIDL
ncbi:hypothetical protein [Acetivibrio cellulolyticus]|uniref:hypothetical protein n=1 Tax=Acetivibrio cellulolyticus TaxID=35830 RepID=UPI0001E2C277|nr:hypothetical protein [Acetivibrio cellulolyticus]